LASREVLISILHGTRASGTVKVTQLIELARTPRDNIHADLEELVTIDLISFVGDNVSCSSEQRIALAVKALEKGADPERVCRKLDWREFEEIATIALNLNGYNTTKHFVFKHSEMKREIDLVGVRATLALCIDCKHWMYGWQISKIRVAARRQIERTEALAAEASNNADRLGLCHATRYVFQPLLVTLADIPTRTVENVPIVPILRTRAFLSELADLSVPPFLRFIGQT